MKMQVYKVGGYVRDTLMGRKPKDVDYVVVGSSQSELLDLGFEQVGADFPVFLHPETGDEWALARTERKSGTGYHGFTVETNGVTLVQDLQRRDLTINAMAFDEEDNLVDPLNGYQDLQNKILRHAGDAFVDDPLRVVRLARLAARYTDFTIHGATFNFAKMVVKSGALNHLSIERFWMETQKAFDDGRIDIYFRKLREFGAFEHVDFFREVFGKVSEEELDYAADWYRGSMTDSEWYEEDQDLNFDMFVAAVTTFGAAKKYKRSMSADFANWATRFNSDSAEEFVNAFNKSRVQSVEHRANLISDIIEVKFGPKRRAKFLKRVVAAMCVSNQEVMDAGFEGAEISAEVKRRRIVAVENVSKE